MPHQTDDAASQSNTRALPLLPYSQGPPASLRSSKPATVDLTSPEPQSPVEPPSQQAVEHPSRLPLKKHKSSDEKRLTGDFHVPADRVQAPHPSSYFARPAAMGKPGAGKGFQPLDTFHGPVVSSSSTRPVTYSKNSRPRSGLIGKDKGAGQREFEVKYLSNNPQTPARKTPSRQNLSSPSWEGAHSKRRKTGHVSSPAYVDLAGDDEVQIVPNPLAQSTPGVNRPALPRSSHSSRSQAVVGSHTPAQPISEFRVVDDLARPIRNKPKIVKSVHTPAVFGDTFDRSGSGSGSVTPRAQDSPIHVIDAESRAPPASARRTILQNFKQGVSSAEGGHTVSPHFPNARINESTSDVQDRVANATNAHPSKKDLRKFMRAPASLANEDAISDDELQRDLPNDSSSMSCRNVSPAKPLRVANQGAKRRSSKKNETGICWPLYYARTHGLEITSSDLREDLQIRQRGNEWEIGLHDLESDEFEVKTRMNPQQINKVSADDIGSIRLEGPRRQDGNCSIFDLVFAEPRDFYIFRDRHALSYAMKQKIIPRSHKDMAKMFARSLATNDKVGTSLPVNDGTPAEEDLRRQDSIRSARSGPWDGTRGTQREIDIVTTNGNSRASNRPTRSTRSSALTVDLEEAINAQDVEKYSVKRGLGSPWQRPLTYGEGRQKATVYFDELPRLDEEEFMNDSLINFYMIYLFDKSNIPKDKVFFFNTYFFTKLTQNTGRSTINYAAVERWTNKVDIFTYDYIVVPINEQTHWYLAVICNVGNIARKPVQNLLSDGAADDATNGSSQVELDNMSINVKGAEPQSEGAPRASSPAPDRNDEDMNLFDEESKLDMIDPEATEAAQQVPISSPARIDPVQPTEGVAVDAPQNEIGPRTVLSNLNASPVKKKTKRKFRGTKKDPDVPIIMILDSLSQTRSSTVRALKDWLAAEGKTRRAMDVTIKEHGFYPKSDQIPTQNNWTDCGVYLLGYAEKFFANPDEFKHKLLTGEMTADEDWPQLKPKEMRNNLRDIIFALAKDQKLTTEIKKKGKKATAMTKSSPPVKTASTGDTELQQPPEESSPPIRNHSTKTKVLVEDNARVESIDEQPKEAPAPRLGSPIIFKDRNDVLMTDRSSTDGAPKASRTSSRSVSPHKVTPRSPGRKGTPGRRTSPEVRVMVQNSPSQTLFAKEQQSGSGAAEPITNQPVSRRKPNSVSPGKRTRAAVEDDDQLRMPPKKKHARDSPQKHGPKPRHMTLDLGQPPEGHSDHPIEIADSQDLKPLTIQSPRRLNVSSPAQRRQPSRSPRKLQMLHHEPSFEEIPRPPNHSRLQKQSQHDSSHVGRQLEVILDKDDETRKMVSMANAGRSTSPADLRRMEEAQLESELMEVDSKGVDPMDTADDTVRETPTPKRSSPVSQRDQVRSDALGGDWVQGDALPH